MSDPHFVESNDLPTAHDKIRKLEELIAALEVRIENLEYRLNYGLVGTEDE